MKVNAVETCVKEQLNELEDRIAASEAKVAQKESVGSLQNNDDRDEQNEIELLVQRFGV